MDLNFTEQEIREHKDSIITVIKVSITCREKERERINNELKRLRKKLKELECD